MKTNIIRLTDDPRFIEKQNIPVFNPDNIDADIIDCRNLFKDIQQEVGMMRLSQAIFDKIKGKGVFDND